MSTRHTHTFGGVLTLEDGSTAHAVTHFEQDVAINPVTAKPISDVTSLSVELILLGTDGVRRRVSIRPRPDGSGVKLLAFDGQQMAPAADLDIEFPGLG